jgi:membrane fusion protein (multidrug efflux system)
MKLVVEAAAREREKKQCQEQEKRKQEQERRRNALVRAVVATLGLVVAAVLLIDWNALRFDASPEGTIDAQLRGNPVRIEARVSGLVSRVGVDDDQPVRQGQLLYEIERDTYRAQLAQNQAMLRQTQAQVSEIAARLTAQQATVTAQAAEAQATQAGLLQSSAELARQTALRGTEGEVLRDWQRAAAADRNNRENLAASRDQVGQAQAQLGVLGAQLAQARAQAEAQQAQVDATAINLGYTRIVAPEDGKVTARLAFLGEYVMPGRQLITFVPASQVWVVANYREEQVARMRVGQVASLHVDAFPSLALRGHVNSIGPASQARSSVLPPDRATGNFTKVVQRIPVKITIDPGQPGLDRLLPGLSVEAKVNVVGPP